MGVFMFHVKFVHYMLKKRQLATRPLMCPRLLKSEKFDLSFFTSHTWNMRVFFKKRKGRMRDFFWMG
jgi:hypothetical protein